MKWMLAFKSFFKALKNPQKAEQFLSDEPKKINDSSDTSHLRLLSHLQDSGRFIDFFQENIDSYTDDQIGSAVRKIHRDCRDVLEDLVTLRPVMDENEGSFIQVSKGFDPSVMKLTGKIVGEPPYKGILVHKGWKAHKRSLPKKIGEQSVDIVFPAEIEIR